MSTTIYPTTFNVENLFPSDEWCSKHYQEVKAELIEDFEDELTTKVMANEWSFSKGHRSNWLDDPAMRADTVKKISEAKKNYWKRWKKENPNYASKWKVNNYKKLSKEEFSATRVDNTSKLNSTIIECPHCKKTGNVGNMKRWHFENCKLNE